MYKGAASAADLGTRVAVSDNISTTLKQSRVRFSAVAGETYHIAVAGRSASQECGIQLNLVRPPANNNFAQARVVNVSTNSELGVSGTNVGATKQTGEPDLNGDAANTTTVWFRFKAPASGLISIDTLGSPTLADTVLAVYGRGDQRPDAGRGQ